MSAGLVIGVASCVLLLGFAFKSLMPNGGGPRKDKWVGDGSGTEVSGYIDGSSDSCGIDSGGDCGGGD